MGHIETVMRQVEATLNPQENLKEEVTALHDVYLHRKTILQEIDAKHGALRHQQRLLAREGVARRARVPRNVRTCVPAVAALGIDVATIDSTEEVSVPTIEALSHSIFAT
jgi:hypothetical protein